jgi:alpha-tubulin suppressor-like RCC1 family protein
MKRIEKMRARGLVLLVATLACHDLNEPGIPDRLVLENAPAELMEGDTVHLKAKVFAGDQQINDAVVTWASSDTTIASIDATGRLMARTAGSVTITARSGGLSEVSSVTIGRRELLLAPAADSARGLALGPFIGCALSNGRAHCWGDNRFQFLGVADTADEILQPTAIIGGFTFKGLYVSEGSIGPRCGLTTNGKAVCWGNGAGATTTPTIMSEHLTFATLGVGDEHICGVDTSGVVFCWGRNSSGQLGRPASAPTLSAEAVSLPEKMVAVTAGYEQTCALSVTGVVYCWGITGPGLGRGDGPLAMVGEPAPVHSSHKFVRLYGAKNNCALTRYGEAYCWGPATNTGVVTSTPTRLPTTLRFVSLTPPSGHTCGLTRENTAYCWGRNEAGQLGNAGVTDILPPAFVAVSGGLRFVQIATAEQFSCGIAADATVYCWGTRRYGRLGDGYSWNRATPVSITPQLSFKEVSHFEFAQCALTTSGKPYCWGRAMGKIVMSGSGDVSIPTPIPGTQTFEKIGVGRENVCLLETSGMPWCVGSPYSSASTLTPVQSTYSFVSLTVGTSHACALTADGTAYCWGSNESGQLGTGDFASSALSARAVSTNLRFIRISASSGYTCGIATNGTTHCWGGDFAGRMGHAALDATCGNGFGVAQPCTNQPKVISDLPGVTDIGTSPYLTCGLDAGGRAYCFGRSATAPVLCFAGSFSAAMPCQRKPTAVNTMNSFHALHRAGALDNGGFPYAFAPAGDGYVAERLESIVSFATFAGQCGITNAQKLYCWGSNEYGTVGDGVSNTTSVPIPTIRLQ